MRLWIALLLLLLGGVPSADGAADSLARALTDFKRHRYEDAARLLIESAGDDGRLADARSSLALGMICLENAELYHDLFRVSLALQRDYLTRLTAVREPGRSRLAHLYLGQTLLLSGAAEDAAAHFQRFLDFERTDPRDRQLARIGLGAARFRNGDAAAAASSWQQVDASSTEIRTALADVFSRYGVPETDPLQMCAQAFDRRETGDGLCIRTVNHLLGVYAREDRIAGGLALLRSADLRDFFHEEIPGENKVLRYYDPSLLDHLTQQYLRAAIFHLGTAAAATDASVGRSARVCLVDGYLSLGDAQKAASMLQELNRSASLPEALKIRLQVREAVVRHFSGEGAAAQERLEGLLRSAGSPEEAAEVLIAASRFRIDCSAAVGNAEALADAVGGRRQNRFCFALGRYFLDRQDFPRAVHWMEAGRDKSHKNRIEKNDPRMLIDLADAYYNLKQFSEALEIFFEMSKQFPALRQIQVALQGIYSMEQKSAGDARIF